MTDRLDTLDSSLAEFENTLKECVEIVIERYRNIDDANAHPGNPESIVAAWFDESLPETGIDRSDLLNEVRSKIYDHPTMNLGTKMFAYVMSGGNQMSVMGDFLASALNQNPAKWHLGPSMTEIERRVIAWTAEFIGLPFEPGGAIVSGGSAANLTGLTVARNLFAEDQRVREKGLYGLKPLIVYASAQTHASVEKSIELLGLGSQHYRKIDVNNDYRIDVDALREQIEIDRASDLQPFCVVGNAGTVNTGAIDPLDELAALCEEAGLWLHVDGAYGGLAAALNSHRDAYAGIERAHSIALDFHKWLYQPFEVGCTLVRNWDALRRTYHKTAEYLDYGARDDRFDISAHHFALSRNAKAFKVWMSFKAYGARRFRAMIEKDIRLAAYLAARVDEADDFELSSSGPLGITCFRYIGAEQHDDSTIDATNKALLAQLELDGRVFITGTLLHGRQVIRACVINHRAQIADMDYLIDVIRDVARSMSD